MEKLNVVKQPHETLETYSLRLLRARKFDVREAQALLASIHAWWGAERIPELAANDDDFALGVRTLLPLHFMTGTASNTTTWCCTELLC